MLSRSFIREKTLQNLYAFYQVGGQDLSQADHTYSRTLEKLYELYINIFALLPALQRLSRRLLDEQEQMFIKKDSNVNLKNWIENSMIAQIDQNNTLILQSEAYRVNWERHEDLLRSLFKDFQKSKTFETYAAIENPTKEEDRYVVSQLIKRGLSNSSPLYHLFADNDLVMASDFDNVVYWIYRAIKRYPLDETTHSETPTGEELSYDLVEDYLAFTQSGSEVAEFGRIILHKTILNDSQLNADITQYLQNWELDRMAILDVLILKMAIIEILHCPSIPVKVTIDESIELSKNFCNDKSRIYINGILNRLVEQCQNEGKILKSGRGLIS